jgi:hypothetical protein
MKIKITALALSLIATLGVLFSLGASAHSLW